jgi:hypothetical protein
MSKNEIFYPIKDFEEFYMITNLGRVYSKRKNIFLKAMKSSKNVAIFNLYKNNKIYYKNLTKEITEILHHEIDDNEPIKEIFYPVKDFEEYYMISNLGRVYSKRRNIFLKASKNNKNVGILALYKNNKMYYKTLTKLIRENIYFNELLKYEHSVKISQDEKHTIEF